MNVGGRKAFIGLVEYYYQRLSHRMDLLYTTRIYGVPLMDKLVVNNLVRIHNQLNMDGHKVPLIARGATKKSQ